MKARLPMLVSVYGGFVKGLYQNKNGMESLVVRALSPLPSITVTGTNSDAVSIRQNHTMPTMRRAVKRNTSSWKTAASDADYARKCVRMMPLKSVQDNPFGSRISVSCVLAVCIDAPNFPFNMEKKDKKTRTISKSACESLACGFFIVPTADLLEWVQPYSCGF